MCGHWYDSVVWMFGVEKYFFKVCLCVTKQHTLKSIWKNNAMLQPPRNKKNYFFTPC